jgi:DMSO/TMAO reductase YedYZ molybdopterin-dependent catalytic subunit
VVLDRIERRRELRRLEEEALAAGRIPPGQALTVKWPVLHATEPPDVDLRTWTFRIFGLVDEPAALTWEQFSSLPRVRITSDVHCVTRWSKLDNQWEGVAIAEVLRHVSIPPRAQFVMVHAPGYSANLPLGALLDEDVLFALKHNGEDLTRNHGGPVRLVVPKRYFWKSVKWVNGLELMEEDRPGFWEVRGYHMEGDPWSEDRFGAW